MRKLYLCLCLVSLGCTNEKPRTWDLVEQDTIYLNDEELNIINIINNATTIKEIFPTNDYPDDIGCYRPSDDSIYIYRELGRGVMVARLKNRTMNFEVSNFIIIFEL